MKILLIEDEESLVKIIKETLENNKFEVDFTLNGKDGYEKGLTNDYDLIILDVMLPEKNGFDILKDLRKNNVTSKIIMLTALSSLENKLDGFNNGADDYLTKPFHIEELLIRVNKELNLLNYKISYEDIYLDKSNKKLINENTNESVDLVCKEYKLLEYLINNQTMILSKEQIYDKVWGIENESESNNMEAYLSFLRKKLKAIGSNVTIKSYRNLGYKLEYQNEKVKK